MTKPNDRFLTGVAWSLGVLAEAFGQPGLAAKIAQEGGFELKDFESDPNVDSYDLDKFRAELKELEKSQEGLRR